MDQQAHEHLWAFTDCYGERYKPRLTDELGRDLILKLAIHAET